MHFPQLPHKKSWPERVLLISVVLSPIGVLAYFLYRLATNAYPSEADSIGIPVFSYWIFVFPLFLTITLMGRNGLHSETPHFFWNPRRNIISFAWTVLSIYPIGLFLVFILLDSIDGFVIGGIAYSMLLFVALIVYRSGAISRI